MIAYLDSSVLLRIVLRQRDALKEWRTIRRGIASALVEVECLRTLDRLRLTERLTDDEIALRRDAVYRLLQATEIVEVNRPVIERAAQPLPTSLGTLDAIHLVTALLSRERGSADLAMATHDETLGRAARASGMRVIGL